MYTAEVKYAIRGHCFSSLVPVLLSIYSIRNKVMVWSVGHLVPCATMAIAVDIYQSMKRLNKNPPLQLLIQ